MKDGIFTREQYNAAIRHYECVAVELSVLADHYEDHADKTTLERASKILRDLAAAGRDREPVGLT